MSGHEDLSLSHLTHVRPWPEVSRMKMSSEDDKKDSWADGHLGGLPRSCFSVSAIYWSSKKKWQRSATSSCPKWWNCESPYLRSLNSSRKRSDSKKRQSIPSVRSALPCRAQWRDTTSRGTFCPSPVSLPISFLSQTYLHCPNEAPTVLPGFSGLFLHELLYLNPSTQHSLRSHWGRALLTILAEEGVSCAGQGVLHLGMMGEVSLILFVCEEAI